LAGSRLHALGIAAVLLLSACASTTAPSQTSVDQVMAATSGRALVLSGGRRLPGPEITSRLSGNTLQDVFRTYTWRFAPDGTFAWGGNGGSDGNWYSTGTWKVEDDAFCWTIDGFDMGCRAVFEWNRILRLSAKDGDGLEKWGFY
jgi:hypothetical protein